MKHWTIKKRIIIGFALLLVLVAVLATASFILLRQVNQEADFMEKDVLPCLTQMAEIRSSVGEVQILALRQLVAKSIEERKKIESEDAAMRTHAAKLLDEYEKSITQAEDRELFTKLKEARDTYLAARARLFELGRGDKADDAIAFNTSTVGPAYASYEAIVDKLVEFNFKDANRSGARSVTAAQRANWITISLSIGVILLGTAFAAVIVIGLTRVLNRLATSLNEGAGQVAAAAGQVSSASQSLAEGASEQAASLEETSSSLEEMSSMTRRNAENAQKANDLAKQARESADRGVTDMREMNSAMEAIKHSSDDIAKIIKTIDEIAFQTNILALNAAVEAARAGEAGMGFAVVADEVRNLAQRSAQAAKETSAKIEGAITRTSQGVQISSKVATALEDIVSRARQVDELVAEVANASREQSHGITQVNAAVSQMDKVTQANAASAEESAAAAEELNAQAETMKESVGQLLELVGGGGPAGGASRPQPVRQAANRPPAALRPKQALAPAGNGQARHGSNGKSSGAKLTATAASRRAEIPLEGDFTDF